VVPVECATRTEAIYREQGYEKLKLEIVEGLTEQSGHWPLPGPVARMLDWCDQVSTASAAQAVRTAASELGKQQPDLAVVAEQVDKARKLVAKAAEDDKKVLPAQLAALQQLLDQAQVLHRERLLAEPAVLDPKAGYGPWVASFLLADAAFGEHAEWRKVMAKPRELAARHGKAIEKAQKQLDKPGKDPLPAAAKVYEDAFLAPTVAALGKTLVAALDAAGAAEAAVLQRVKAVQSQRATDTAAAKKAATELLAPLLVELKTAAPELFAASDAGDEK
jgi:hypothetical protein